jgi:hypothetical protein
LVIDNRTLEFDSGLTLIMPSAAAIAPRESVTITDASGLSRIFEFVDSPDLPADIRTVAGDQLLDGDTFTVGDGTTTQNFEFDSGLSGRCCDRGPKEPAPVRRHLLSALRDPVCGRDRRLKGHDPN